MESDIVERLRAVLHDDRSVELMSREAADEIDRLHAELADAIKQRDEARRLHHALLTNLKEGGGAWVMRREEGGA